jgi:hypothetical protein
MYYHSWIRACEFTTSKPRRTAIYAQSQTSMEQAVRTVSYRCADPAEAERGPTAPAPASPHTALFPKLSLTNVLSMLDSVTHFLCFVLLPGDRTAQNGAGGIASVPRASWRECVCTR